MKVHMSDDTVGQSAKQDYDHHAQYICLRMVDALLRENVRECISRARLMSGVSQSMSRNRHAKKDDLWLKIEHFGKGCLWIPVIHSVFMQSWRGAGLPLLWQEDERIEKLYTPEDILACFSQDLHSDEALSFKAFAQECQQAVQHRVICEIERKRWFAEYRAQYGAIAGSALLDWHARLLHYDRLGAFLDHPFYPTARAKLGFDAIALTDYSPEFQKNFLLHWLAVPRTCFYPSTTGEKGLPELWPSFEAVGLPSSLVNSHELIPVHPFVWRNHLDDFLCSVQLQDVVRAPRSCLMVTPTLSVRTVALLESPEWHLKLPLTIRTLGAKNIRTIKPSTIHDGHCVQTMLSDIASREASIADRLLLTREDSGGHVNQQVFLGYILRRYPVESLEDSTLIPVAALLAATPAGNTVLEEIAAQFYAGKLESLWHDYLDVTLRFHLLLWVRYGIALESNQQNSIVVFSKKNPRLRLLLKDNDAARIHLDYLVMRWPSLAPHVASLKDRRMMVTDALPLAQMFMTITLQLNIAVLAEGIGPMLGKSVGVLYSDIRCRIETILAELARDGEEILFARQVLLENDQQYIKYLLTAATLTEKSVTGADDVNKFYGMSAPNFLRMK